MNGKALKFLLEYNEMSVETFAKHLKIKPRLAVCWCYGVHYPSIEQLKEIARLFNVSVDFLLGLSMYKTLRI